jgi:hypothetical protein
VNFPKQWSSYHIWLCQHLWIYGSTYECSAAPTNVRQHLRIFTGAGEDSSLMRQHLRIDIRRCCRTFVSAAEHLYVLSYIHKCWEIFTCAGEYSWLWAKYVTKLCGIDVGGQHVRDIYRPRENDLPCHPTCLLQVVSLCVSKMRITIVGGTTTSNAVYTQAPNCVTVLWREHVYLSDCTTRCIVATCGYWYHDKLGVVNAPECVCVCVSR